MSDDVAEIAALIARLEQSGLSRRAIAEGSGIGASQVSRIMLGDAKNPTFRVVTSIRRFHDEVFPNAGPQPTRFAPGCQPRAGR
ncbi:helix-turn-helix domain-containing protein [Sinorhizobium meliloti]|uniref:helix-turn-helix domain-containing protein n=1 Tax=Rhizobium meliloti TaxID=382 RepID=UPI0039A51BFE